MTFSIGAPCLLYLSCDESRALQERIGAVAARKVDGVKAVPEQDARCNIAAQPHHAGNGDGTVFGEFAKPFPQHVERDIDGVREFPHRQKLLRVPHVEEEGVLCQFVGRFYELGRSERFAGSI